MLITVAVGDANLGEIVMLQKYRRIFNQDFENAFQAYIRELREIIDQKLSKLVSNIPYPDLRSRIGYALLSRGKRLRPILTILSAQSVGGDRESVVRLALAFEVLHTSTLVHDDIIDRDKVRRGLPTLHEKWSINDAILVGDALIAISIGLVADYGPRIIKITSACGLQLSSGEIIDISLSLNDMDEKDYFIKIKGKSASLFKASTECGAIAGGGSDVEVESLAKFGEYYGIAYQLKDDLEDLIDPDSLLLDMRNGRATLPLIYLYRHGDSNVRRLLDEYFGKQELPKNVVEEILRELNNTGAIEYCKEKIAENIDKACTSISTLKESRFKNYLIYMANLIEQKEKLSQSL